MATGSILKVVAFMVMGLSWWIYCLAIGVNMAFMTSYFKI